MPTRSAKINVAYYRDVVLRRMLLPDICTVSRSEFFVFQQGSAPSHGAKDTVALLEQVTPDFIPPTLWPPNSPDIGVNPAAEDAGDVSPPIFWLVGTSMGISHQCIPTNIRGGNVVEYELLIASVKRKQR